MTQPPVKRTSRVGVIIAATAVAAVTFFIASSEWSRRTRNPAPADLPPGKYFVAEDGNIVRYDPPSPRRRETANSDGQVAQSKAPDVQPFVAKSKPPGPAPRGMVWIPGGVFHRGSDSPNHADSRPWHAVEISGFWMDEAPVTNEQFAQFVAATKYVTIAERTPRKEDFPDAPPENLVAGAVVFSPPNEPVPLNNHYIWWRYIKGADWRHPEGPESTIAGRKKHPVVQVAYDDALIYCKWAGKRLPTEAEYEFAARGGLVRKRYAWGDELLPGGKWMTNIWQGRFPVQNNLDDGYRLTAPVKTYPANGFGLYDVAGNVWQWCADWYRDDYYQALARLPQPVKDPQGPTDSFDPGEPGVGKRVVRGGSFLCSDQYCTAYEVGVRGKTAPDTGTNHQGFRCARSR